MSDVKRNLLIVGVVLLVCTHAILNAFALRVPVGGDTVIQSTGQAKSYTFDTIEGTLQNPAKVNVVARDEVKKQGPLVCPDGNCATQPQTKAAVVNNIDIFVGTDPQSKALLSWFNTDAALVGLKKKCNFHAYGNGNELYKQRYATYVPVASFPAILFTRHDGGHIYIANRDTLPSTPSELFGAMRDAYALSKKAVETPPKPVLPTLVSTVANLADIKLPDASTMDCPDGNCPTPPNANRKPLLPWRDGGSDLFPANTGGSDLVSGLFRATGYSLETILIVGLLVVVAIYVTRK